MPNLSDVSPLIAAALLALVTQAASVGIQPGTARPGDAVLVTVEGADGAKEPAGRLGDLELEFHRAGIRWQALVGLPVALKDGALELAVKFEADAVETVLEGSLEVVPPEFRRSELHVAKKFVHPSKAEREWSAKDQKAFNAAFAQERSDPLFVHDFILPRPAEVTAPFGDLRMFNGKKQSQHFGTDLNGAIGDDAYASNDGRVVMVRGCFGSGNTVVLFHGMGLYTAYFHLSRFDVKEGQTVKQGQRLGLVGKTGRVTGPHLHWGAKISGRWVDAESLLRLQFE